jgi:hypothetical protein
VLANCRCWPTGVRGAPDRLSRQMQRTLYQKRTREWDRAPRALLHAPPHSPRAPSGCSSPVPHCVGRASPCASPRKGLCATRAQVRAGRLMRQRLRASAPRRASPFSRRPRRVAARPAPPRGPRRPRRAPRPPARSPAASDGPASLPSGPGVARGRVSGAVVRARTSARSAYPSASAHSAGVSSSTVLVRTLAPPLSSIATACVRGMRASAVSLGKACAVPRVSGPGACLQPAPRRCVVQRRRSLLVLLVQVRPSHDKVIDARHVPPLPQDQG